MDILQELAQSEYAVATTLNAEDHLKTFVFSGVSKEKAEIITQILSSKELLGARLERERALRVDDLSSHSDLVEFLPPDFSLKSLLMAPIINEGKIIGRIYLCNKRNHRGFTLDDEVLSMSFANAFAQTLIRFRKIMVSQRAQEALFLDHQRAQVTLESIGDAVITIDSQGRIDYLNPLAEELIGTTQSQAQGKSLEKVACLLDEESRSHVIRDIAAWLAQEPVESHSCTALLQDARNQELIVQTSIAPLRDSQDRIFGAVLVLRDISPLRALASQLSYQATHDALTGLINRREFEVRLRQALDDVRQNDTHHVLCYLDLDQFKVVNDTCGHLAGDKLLRQLATLLQERIREADCLGRLGGDEFGVLLLGCHLDQARGIAESLRILIRDFRFNWKGKAFQLGVSIGLVSLARGSGGLEEVLSAADTACYVAKDQGRDRIHTYRLDDCIVERHHGEIQWVARIQQAFEESRFLIYYQPIHALNEEEHICHGEVLLRMKGEDEGLIPPMAFIPAAERYRLMSALDRWVISNTFIALEKHSIGHGLIGINLSGQSVCDELFLKFVIEQLQRSPINPRMICFEITETAAVANFDSAIRFIRELKEIGCRFALDDFGSGLSSFNYLKNLPVDYLKIDGSFVKDMVDDPVDYAMVEAIHKVGKVMGLKTIAEFVENEAVLEKLRGIGVDYVQGLVIGVPRPFHNRPLIKNKEKK
ncbi:EAL domain-containing protein [Nitrosococcus wardiae]|uniref:EAL domain-containing protein n=2 Tax=Nitrosococcus wardiae TaxID=1814290 RepID=A0A4P7C1E7_9GAMM|nr:EAL domain-containing protein [Nitrosococcus wardiae]